MRIDTFRGAIRLLGLVLPMAVLASSAQGQAFGVAVNTATVNQKLAYVALPMGESMASNQNQSASVPGLVTAQDLFAIVTGDGDPSDGPTAVSSATLGVVSLLNGLITADGIVAMASSSIGDAGANSNAAGSSLANLVIGGSEISDPAPNTRVNLPGVGYVLLNEQRPSGDGVTTSGMTVNMIHVVLQQPILGLLGQITGYRTVGDIVVGSATSKVTR